MLGGAWRKLEAVVKPMTDNASSRSGADRGLRAAKNAAVLVLLRFLMPALSIALVLMLSRYLGAEGLGRYALAFSFLYVFNAVAPLGLGAVITRDAARDPARLEKLLGNSITLGIITSVVLTPIMMGCTYVFDYDSDTRTAVILLALAIVPCTLGVFFDAAFVARERIDYFALCSIVEYAVKVGAGVWLLFWGYGLPAVLAAAVIGRVLACGVAAFLLRRIAIVTQWSWDRQILHELLRIAPTFLFIGIFSTLYWRIDIFMLSKLKPVEEVGLYSAAWRILELAMILPQSLCLALYPQMAAATDDQSQLRTLNDAAMRYLVAVTLPLVMCVVLLAQPLIAWLYGERFGRAALTLSVLIMTLVPYGLVRYHAYLLVSANRQRIDLQLNMLMSAINISLNWALIPQFGHLGAAWATFLSICAYGLAQYFYLHRNLPGHAGLPRLEPSLLFACSITALGVWLLRDSHVLVSVLTAPLLYGVLLIATGFFTREELRLLGLEEIMNKLGLLRQ